MSSASNLRARIGELSSAIDRQKQVLRDLESSKSKAQRDLNAILDPMSRLPIEISSEIFQLCIPDSPGPDSSDAPTLFLSICHLWSNIALSTPSLWNTIHIDNDSADWDLMHLEAWLSRARSLPVSFLSLGILDPTVIPFVKQHADRWCSLDVEVNSPDDLREMTTGTLFPSLKHLRAFDMGGSFSAHHLRHCAEALHAAPALFECEFVNMYAQGLEDEDDDVDVQTHLSLRHLQLGEYAEGRGLRAVWGSSSRLLKKLTLPALETLYIGDLDIPTRALSSFLTRSAPPLRSLCMVPYDAEIDGTLGAITTLTNLTLHSDDTRPTVLDMMATEQNFLPNLQSLTIRGWYPDPVDDPILIGMLGARCKQLRSFRIFFQLEIEPHESLIEILRGYVEDGMDIHVGLEEHNYI